jgi:hypothetical protein
VLNKQDSIAKRTGFFSEILSMWLRSNQVNGFTHLGLIHHHMTAKKASDSSSLRKVRKTDWQKSLQIKTMRITLPSRELVV